MLGRLVHAQFDLQPLNHPFTASNPARRPHQAASESYAGSAPARPGDPHTLAPPTPAPLYPRPANRTIVPHLPHQTHRAIERSAAMKPIIDPIQTPSRTIRENTIAGLALAAISAAVLAAAPAYSQQLPPQANHPAVREAAAVCAADIQKHCANVVPGGGRIVRCLAANEQSVTPDCKASIMKAKTALGL